jgi:hypothetical protein
VTALLIAVLMTGQLMGVGLDWSHNVFVQEYWQSGNPHYAIANLGNATAKIAVYEERTGNKIAGPWEVGPKQVIRADAARLQGKGLLEFRLEPGILLGLLDAPRKPRIYCLESGDVVTVQGLNGSGGRNDELWFEQPSLTFPPESDAALVLIVRPGIGEISYSREKLPDLEIKCDTLPVQSTKEQITIDTNRPMQKLMYHRISLRFKTPKAAQPMIMVVDGWRWIVARKNGQGVTRGIIIDRR